MERARRILGLDLARALAVFGMVVVNLSMSLGVADVGISGFFTQIFSGRAAAVFVVLAGVGLSLMAGGRRREATEAAPHRRRIAFRAAFLALLGFGWLPLWPADILHYYSAWLLLGALALTWSDRALVWAALGAVLAFPSLFLFLDYDTGWNWTTLEYAGIWTPAGFIRNLLFNGFHPVFPWVAFLFGGMWLGRQDLRSTTHRRRLVGVLLPAWLSVELVARSLEALLVADGLSSQEAHALVGVSPMTPMPPYILGSGMLAALIILGSIEVAERFPELTRSLRKVGQQALTHYVAHVLFLVVPLWIWQEEVSPLSSGTVFIWFLAYIAAAPLASSLWKRRFSQGPLEMVMRAFSDRRSLVPRRAS